MRIEPMTCAIGAELLGVRLADAVRDDALFSEIRAALLRHKVLFLRDQGLSEAAVLLDSGNRLGQLTGSYGMPTTLFYDAQGRLKHSQMGELSAASLEYGLGQLKD